MNPVFRRIITFIILIAAVGTYSDFVYAHQGEGIIEMTENGFYPPEIIVDQGTAVEFENVSDELRWPASNIHPTHNVYPGSGIEKCGTGKEKSMFDSCRGIKPGETYTFTFEEPGEWRYHDHLFPRFTGVVRIRRTSPFPESPTPTPVSMKQTGKSIFNFEFIYEKLRDLFTAPEPPGTDYSNLAVMTYSKDKTKLAEAVKQLGIKKIMEKLVAESDGGSAVDCHSEAHYIGRIGYELVKEKAFEQCDASCHSGCYHGAMEVLLSEKGTENLNKNIDEVCNTFDTHFGYYECLHGIGHGLTAYLDYDIPLALKSCKSLSDDFKISSCYGGVFMENIVAGQGGGAKGPGHETEWLNKTDPLFPCNTLEQDEAVQAQCYGMQTSWMLTISGYDFDTVASQCLKAPAEMINVCFSSFGRDAAGNSLRDPVKIVALCEKVEKQYRQSCYYGALNVIIDFWGPGLQGQGSALCKIIPGADTKTKCYELLAGRLQGVFGTEPKWRPVCALFEKEYQYLCNGSKVN